MKINSKDLWKHVGDVILVKADLPWTGDEEYINLKAGTYLIVEAGDSPLFYNLYTSELASAEPFEDDVEFINITTPPLERLELLLDALTKQITQLAEEGWEVFDDDKPDLYRMDISPYIAKAKVIQLLHDTLSKGPKEDGRGR